MSKNIRSQIMESYNDIAEDTERVYAATIRLVVAAMKDKDKALNDNGEDESNDKQLSDMLKKMIHQRNLSIINAEKNGSDELVFREQTEIDIISKFLPPSLDQDAMEKIIIKSIENTNASSLRDFKTVIQDVLDNCSAYIDIASAKKIFRSKIEELKQ